MLSTGAPAPAVHVPQHGYHRPIEYQPEPIVERGDHPENLKEWQQLESNHIRLGEAHGLETIGTSYLTGRDRKHYQVELGIDSDGDTMLYRPDVIMRAGWDTTKWILVEDKWQGKGGSCEAKVFEVHFNLAQALAYDQRVVAAYLILDGPGWSKKNKERFKLHLSTTPSPVRVFFSDEDFLNHGIPEAWNDPEQAAPTNPRPNTPSCPGGRHPQPQLRLL